MEPVLQGWLVKSPPEKKSFGTWKIFGAVKYYCGGTVILVYEGSTWKPHITTHHRTSQVYGHNCTAHHLEL